MSRESVSVGNTLLGELRGAHHRYRQKWYFHFVFFSFFPPSSGYRILLPFECAHLTLQGRPQTIPIVYGGDGWIYFADLGVNHKEPMAKTRTSCTTPLHQSSVHFRSPIFVAVSWYTFVLPFCWSSLVMVPSDDGHLLVVDFLTFLRLLSGTGSSVFFAGREWFMECFWGGRKKTTYNPARRQKSRTLHLSQP